MSVGIEDDYGSLIVGIGQIRDILDKWKIPRSARQSFRVLAFECLLLVGEQAMLRDGAQALLGLKPDEFHRIFSPLLASMGDSKNFETWLENTEDLARFHFSPTNMTATKDLLARKKHQKVIVEDENVKLPANIGNAFNK